MTAESIRLSYLHKKPVQSGENRQQSVQLNGVWHTSVVVDGKEYFYGGGVQQAMAGTTPYGEPVDIIYLG